MLHNVQPIHTERVKKDKKLKTLEAKDALRNINRTHAAKRAEKCRFLSLVTLTFYSKLI